MRCLAKRPADRFQTAAELLAALEPLATPASGITPTHTQPIQAHRRRIGPWLAVAAAVLLVGVVGWKFVGRGGNSSVHTIAVLPFDNVAHDTADDYLADGMANEVRSGLMKLPGLSVKARTSSDAAKGKPVREAGALLNVGALLQGSFRHTADKTTVTVELVNVPDESALWTASFILPADGNFAAAQDSITAAVAAALHLARTTGVESAQAQRGTRNGDAYDLFLKGKFFFGKRGSENLQRSVTYYRNALALDPTFARAEAALAMAYTVLPSYEAVGSTDSLIREAARLARHALTIDSTVAEAHLALGSSLNGMLRPIEAEPQFAAAVALDPRNVTARQWHGDNLAQLGRFDEAIREGRESTELDPLSAVAGNDLSYSLLGAGQYAAAARTSRRAVELDSTMSYAGIYLGVAYAFQQQVDSAAAAFERVFRRDSAAPQARAYHVWRFALLGRWADADRELAEVERRSTGDGRDLDLSIAYAGVGNRKAALDAIEHGVRQHDFYFAVTMIGCDPTFAQLRQEPRLPELLKIAEQGSCTGSVNWPIPPRPGSAKR